MNRDKTMQETTFWRFLSEKAIQIPLIQRDYAQGRKGRESLRTKFLGDLKNALDSATDLKLDFVYGSEENGYRNPLDGQQRLTTLWLLHWYIAYRSGQLSDPIKKVFKKFTYETRVSSRDFCGKLVELATGYNPNQAVPMLADFIRQQTWFYSAWKQDPTIQSMLRMLSGTRGGDENQKSNDCIEAIFGDSSKLKEYWDKLTESEGRTCPIFFYYLDLPRLAFPDALYIKMNARGEQLTSFENFKADFVGKIAGKDLRQAISEQLDTTWTDLFWKNRKVDCGAIDEIYFAFLNRFFLHALICKNNPGVAIEKQPAFTLYGEKSDDSKVSYQSFGPYQEVVSFGTITSLVRVLNNFSKWEGAEEQFAPSWDGEYPRKSGFHFIPIYTDTRKIVDSSGRKVLSISTLTQPQRVVFHAICKYFDKEPCITDENDSFAHWMRVVWNLVENADVNTISMMCTTMRKIDSWGEHSHQIYKYLNSLDIKDNKEESALEEQAQEEIRKVKLIIKDITWEEKIIKAESYVLLKGKIWVLFSDEEMTSIDKFVARFTLLSQIFEKSRNHDGTSNYHLVKVLLSHYQGEPPKEKMILTANEANWKVLITRTLFGTFRHIEKDEIHDGSDVPQYIKDLTMTDLLEKSPRQRVLKGTTLYSTLGATWIAYGNVILNDNHNQILGKILEAHPEITSEQRLNGCDFFCGTTINLRYRKSGCNYFFQLKRINRDWCPNLLKDGEVVRLGPNEKMDRSDIQKLYEEISHAFSPKETAVENP